MEKLIIHIPDTKSNMVKHILHSLGIAIPGFKASAKGNYKQKLMNVSTWSDDDIRIMEDNGKSFNDFKSEE